MQQIKHCCIVFFSSTNEGESQFKSLDNMHFCIYFFSSFYFLSWKRKCNNYVFFLFFVVYGMQKQLSFTTLLQTIFYWCKNMRARDCLNNFFFQKKKNTNIKDTSLQTNKEASMRQNNILSRIVYQSNHPTSFRSSISSWRQ